MKPFLAALFCTMSSVLLAAVVLVVSADAIAVDLAAQSAQPGGIAATTRIDGLTVGALLAAMGGAGMALWVAGRFLVRMGAALEQWKAAIASTANLPALIQQTQVAVEKALEVGRANTDAIAEIQRWNTSADIWRATVDVNLKRFIG